MIATGPKSAGITPATRPTIGRMPSYEPVDLSAACNAGVEVAQQGSLIWTVRASRRVPVRVHSRS